MSLTITPGFGGLLQFQNFSPLAPSLITANLRNFWDLPQVAQTETLASAYQHLSGVQVANQGLLESVGQLVQRFNAREERTPADSFIISRLIGEWGTLKDSVPPSNPQRPRSDAPATEAAAPAPRTPVSPLRREDHNPSMQFYTDSKGGLFPPSWLHFSKEMRDTLKIRVWELKPKESRALISDEEAHANFLVGVLAAWIIDMKTSLNETGAKGAGESGLASAPTVRPSLELIDEMSAFMAAAASTGDPLSGPFWQTYGTHVELRTAINRLTSMRTLLASLEESERGAVEDTLYALDAVYLSFLLGPLVDRPGEEMADAPARDEAHGVMLAKKLGDVMVGFPMVLSSNLSATEQVQLSSIEAILRTVGREARTMPPTPSIRSFLRQLLPSELLRLGTLVALIRRKTTT